MRHSQTVRENGGRSILRPRSLSFESFANGTDEWSYFRIELDELAPSGVYGAPEDDEGEEEEEEERVRDREEVTQIGPGVYTDAGAWDRDTYDDEEGQTRALPDGASRVTRYFRGAFVIFGKRSTYNLAGSTYDARHNKMSAEDFRAYIGRSAAAAASSATSEDETE